MIVAVSDHDLPNVARLRNDRVLLAQNPRLKLAKCRSAIAVWSMLASVHHDNFRLKNGTWNNLHTLIACTSPRRTRMQARGYTKMALQTLGGIAETGTSEVEIATAPTAWTATSRNNGGSQSSPGTDTIFALQTTSANPNCGAIGRAD